MITHDAKQRDRESPIIIALILLVSVALIFKFVAFPVIVIGDSMLDTYSSGDILWATTQLSQIHRYDIVIAYAGQKKIIKRVIGLPGDTIRIEDGVIFINSSAIANSKERINDAGVAADEITMGENEYFVMGDNCNNSRDSRIFGGLPYDKIRGKIIGANI